MGGKAPSSPPPTPPGETAKADFGAQAATAGFGLQHGTPNQFSPGGSVTFDKYGLPDQSLGNGQTVPGGEGVSGVHTKFSPQFQGIFDRLTSSGASLADQLPHSGFNPDIDTAAFRQSYIDEGLRDVRPEWDRQDDQFKITMSERGIPIGSEIDQNERNRVGEQRGSYVQGLTNQGTQAAAANEAQQFAQQLTEHQVPFSDFSNFYNGVQGMQASLQGRDSPLIAANMKAPDVAGITARYDQANQQRAQMAAQSKNSAMGLFGQLGGGLLGLLGGSDERIKENIEKVGELDDGQNIYTYQYKGDQTGTSHMGLMAQEVEQRNPDAVSEFGGVKFVDYKEATKGSNMAKFLRKAS